MRLWDLFQKRRSFPVLTKELSESDVCLVLAEEYVEKAKEAAKWVEVWGVLVDELTGEISAYTKEVENHSWYAKNADLKAEDSEERAEKAGESSNPVVCESLIESPCLGYIRSQCEYDNKADDWKCFDFWTSFARSQRSKANDERRKARAYSGKAEEAETVASIARVWLQTSTEQAEAFTALGEGYTALSKEDVKLSELSIALVAEAYTTLSKTYSEQAREFLDQSEELTTIAEAYTELEKASVALAEN